LKKADVDAQVAGLEKDVDQFNHDRKIEVDGRTLALAS
jgi:hypothetical protein